ncbi:hypothetical protein [Nonomuraea ceibae]|uniref:hypothetical protein n=1 Tax=Nonomuraea ceibae TaxID=1935170 RepID=UPI001C5EB1F2|nr:hypothetical protein [Nonomuraea ceibae]
MISPAMVTLDPCRSAEILRDALQRDGINSDVHDGYGLALVSVWVGLVVWCDGERLWWRTGWNADRRRVIYAWHPASDPLRAARRIAMRYAELRAQHHPITSHRPGTSAEPL